MLLSLGLYWTAWDMLYAGLKFGRAPRTKETLPDFLKWRRVTRPPLIFRGLTGSQRTPGFWGVTKTSSLGVFDECKTHLCFEFISHAILCIWYPYSCETHKISSKLGFVGLLMKSK